MCHSRRLAPDRQALDPFEERPPKRFFQVFHLQLRRLESPSMGRPRYGLRGSLKREESIKSFKEDVKTPPPIEK